MRRAFLGIGIGLAVLVAIGSLPDSPADVVPGLKDGDVLDSSTWQYAEGYLPAEILDHYRKNEYVNRVVDLHRPDYVSILHPEDFRTASEANRGRFELSPAGSIVERATGEQPRFILGLPFPEVTPDDPAAGTKIVWNFFYATWYNGCEHFLTELVMLSRSGVDRRVVTEVQTLWYDGNPEARDLSNPENLLMQRFARVTSPADLAGTTSLTWRFRDPAKHDALWTYVPGLRRVRQVSALNRSDGFMGSDICLDDGSFFDGKPEDFTFRLLEKRDQLAFMDPYSLSGHADILPVEGGGWRILWKDVPRIGADDPSWKGVPWAPVSVVLVKRPTWIVEAIPRDPNYLYGRLVLRIDAETYHGSFVTKYDRAGTLLMSYQASCGTYFPVDGGKSYISAGGVAVRTAENFLYDRATVILFPPRKKQNPADYRVRPSPELFTSDALVRYGR